MNSELLSWFLANDGECQHLILGQEPRRRPDPKREAGERLAEHMPELVPTWRRLAEMVDDEHAGAVLALWNPPAFLTGCSQAVVSGRSPALVRNYDWDYRLYDGVVMRTAYGGRRVLGMGDCLWGLLDGVNDAGIAVSLTFGGRPNVGTGFGIPIVLRYVLQASETIDAAVDALTRIPVHMSYNVTVLDAEGRHATVYVRHPQQITGCRGLHWVRTAQPWPSNTPKLTAHRCPRNEQLAADLAQARAPTARRRSERRRCFLCERRRRRRIQCARCACSAKLIAGSHVGLKRKPIGRGNERFEDPGL